MDHAVTVFAVLLRQVDFHGAAVNIHMLGNDGNDLILHGFHNRGRDISPVVDEDELQPLFGHLRTGRGPAQETIDKIAHVNLPTGCCRPAPV